MPWVSGDVKRLTLRESQGLQEVSLSRNWNYFSHWHYTFHCIIFWHFRRHPSAQKEEGLGRVASRTRSKRDPLQTSLVFALPLLSRRLLFRPLLPRGWQKVNTWGVIKATINLKGERDSWIYEQKWVVTSEFYLPFLKTSIFLRNSHTRQIVDVFFLNSRRMKCFFKYRDAWNEISTPPPLSPPFPFPSPFATLN